MKHKRVKSLKDFTRMVPEELLEQSRLVSGQMMLSLGEKRISGRYKQDRGDFVETCFDFVPKIMAISHASCTCEAGTRGQVCIHLCALALRTVAEYEGQETGAGVKSLSFLDKYFNSPVFQDTQFKLSIEILPTAAGLDPQIRIHRRISADKYSPGKKFTANDSYKLGTGEPADEALLEYLRNFRQVLFYSNYSLSQKYNWGFWLSLVGHPRLTFEERPVSLISTPLHLSFDHNSEREIFRLVPDYEDFEADDLRYYDIDGGLLGYSQEENALVLSQIDKFRSEMIMDVIASRPILARKDLLDDLPRLEKLQNFFQIVLPEELSSLIKLEKPQLILQLDMEAGAGFSLKPRIRYRGTDLRLLPGESGQYLSGLNQGIIQRDADQEEALLQEFVNHFPYEEELDKELQISITELDRAFILIQWLKEHGKWELEWLRKEPKRQNIGNTTGLRVQIDSKAWLKIHIMAENKNYELNHFPVDDDYLGSTDYVAVGEGEWLQIDANLRRQLNRLKLAVQQEKRAMKLKASAMAVLATINDVTWEGNSEWVEKLEAWRTGRADYQPSKRLKCDLRGYQLEGYRWLRRMSELGVGVCLADDMGLGKTVQALAVLLDRLDKGPILVIAPASVCFNWKEEIRKFTASLSPWLYSESGRAKSLSKLKKGSVVIISYAMALREIEKLLKTHWGTMVLDEAQFIKNALSQTAMAVSSLNRSWTLALTGTPLENHLGELWSIFRMLNKDLLGTWDSFRKNYVAPIEKNESHQKMEELRQLIRPFILRRTKRDVLADLPDRTEIELKVEMGDIQRLRYEQERARILNQLDQSDERMRFKLLAAITRLRQLACHPSLCDQKYKGESAKLKLFSELVEELVAEDNRALVFSQFTSFLDLVARELNRIHIPHVIMTGETPVKHRQAIIQRFQSGEVPVFLVSLRAGGTGINLTSANYVFHMDPWWNPAVEEQAIDRAHRIGQTQAVTVYRLVAAKTIEETILKIHARKKDLVERLLEGQEDVGKLSVEDLVEIIKGAGV